MKRKFFQVRKNGLGPILIVPQLLGQAILESGEIDVIKEHFGSRLQFGTAGLRGEMPRVLIE